MALINFLLRLMILSPVFFMMIQPLYDVSSSDIPNYYSDYVNQNNSYEIGYEAVVAFFRDILNFSFESYWLSYMFLQTVIMALIFNRLTLVIIALPTLLSLSSYYFGIQIRYSLYSLLFIYSIKYLPRYSYFSTFVFHTGSIFTIFGKFIYDLFLDKIRNIFELNVKSISLLTILTCISFFTNSIVNVVLSDFSRFSYYEGSSLYLEGKSVVSTIYIYLSIFFILYANTKIDYDNKKEVDFGITILYLVVLTLSVTALSGRIFLLYLVFSPIIINIFIVNRKTRIIGFLLLLMSMAKLIFEII